MEVTTQISVAIYIFLTAVLASAAGTGGGALYMPGFVVALNDIHKAVPLSKVTILGSCLMSVLINSQRRHQKSKQPLIAHELAALLEPFTLLGGVVGVLLNIVMTDIQILACLIITLIFTAYKTVKKGLKQRAEETRLLNRCRGTEIPQVARNLEREDFSEEGHGLLTTCILAEDKNKNAVYQDSMFVENITTTDSNVVDTTFFTKSASFLDVEAEFVVDPEGDVVFRQDPENSILRDCNISYISVLYLVGVSIVNVILLIYSGGPVALICGDNSQQLSIYALLSFHVLATYLYGKWLYKINKRRIASGYVQRDVADGGLGWISPVTIFLYPILSFFAGVLAGAVGIGGGLIKGPLLLEIGLNPLSAVSTANYMILFTSSANTLQYAILGRLDFSQSITFFICSFLAGGLGLVFIYHMMKKTHRQSYITFFLSFVVMLSIVSMVSSFTYTHYFADERHAPKLLTLQDACEAHKNAGRLMFTHY